MVADADDDFRSALPLLDEFGDEGWRMLEVGIDTDDGIARGGVDAGRGRRFFAEVSGEVDGSRFRIVHGQLVDDVLGCVGASVVDKGDVEVIGECLHNRADSFKNERDILLFIVDRDDDADVFVVH